MAKCLDCGKVLPEGVEFCSTECFKKYYLYVFGEDSDNHPEFKAVILGDDKYNILVKGEKKE
jgi:hypothetical protein